MPDNHDGNPVRDLVVRDIQFRETDDEQVREALIRAREEEWRRQHQDSSDLWQRHAHR